MSSQQWAAVACMVLGWTTTCLAQSQPAPKLAPLPIPITSFGAAAISGKLYVYGGHMGNAHAYYNEDQSDKLLVLDTSREGSQWEELSTHERLQGMGMVAYRDDLIVIGGFTALNKRDEKQNLVSSDRVQAFDTKQKQWRNLPPLPEPRSSHDAAIIGSKIYVVGGWNMQSDAPTKWHSTAWSLDLAQDKPAWSKLPDPPFTRRALALIAHDQKLFVVGGMNEKGGPTKDVEIFEPASQSWSRAGAIVGKSPMAGFGASGWSSQGELLVSTYEGEITRWDAKAKDWVASGKTQDARFFHRVLPLPSGSLVAIGGANMESGKFLDLELISPQSVAASK